ncbi:MAG: hypothetical protein HC767_04475 [Akkermansiaceae bacterium]|nr:hypothetical protein [Akkermansiaceae bacterium]
MWLARFVASATSEFAWTDSTVADATRGGLADHRGLKPTAKVRSPLRG